MPEMVGDAVRLINPYSTAELADEIVALLSDEASRKELSAASLRWSAASPNWDDRAAQLLEFIEGRAL
jgi:glycosyltransferase involved in cell wall biosynthesis